jgi:hypothetical protein
MSNNNLLFQFSKGQYLAGVGTGGAAGGVAGGPGFITLHYVADRAYLRK